MDQSFDPNRSETPKRLSAEAAVYGATACIAAWLLAITSSQVGKPVTLFGAPAEGLAPDAMPRMVLVALFVAAAAGLVTSFRKGGGQYARPGLRVLVTSGASFLFAAVLIPLGFVLASALTVGLLAIYLGGRHPIGLALAGFGVPVAIYLIFTRVLHISLPPGLAGF